MIKYKSYGQERTQNRVQKQIDTNNEILAAACNSPIVFSDEDAAKVLKGWEKMNKVSDEEWEAVKKLDKDQLIKRFGDGEIAAAIEVTDRALAKVFGAMTGTDTRSKSFYADGLKDEMSATLMVNTGLALGDNQNFDTGWTPAFNSIGAQNVTRIKVNDIRAGVQMFELANASDKVPDNQKGSQKDEYIDARYFGAGLPYSFRENRHNLLTVNNYLGMLRTEAAHNINRQAYREIFRSDANSMKWKASDLVSKFAADGSSDLNDLRNNIIRDRKALNEAHFRLVNAAIQEEADGGKKRKGQYDSAPLQVNAQSTMLAYHSFAHFEYIETMRAYRVPDMGVETPILRNFAFVNTVHAPVCGSHTITESKQRDMFGFFETVKDDYPTNQAGLMLIIPAQRNFAAFFRNTTFFTDQMPNSQESVRLVVKQEQNFVKDYRQFAHLLLDGGTK
ncbi:MAG: hypothetical protein HRU40_08335 [Saprospiraceae bacterium]|nr:hypothetical protein [Saprospiraceae bacterium]